MPAASTPRARLVAATAKGRALGARALAADARWWVLGLLALALIVRLPLIVSDFSTSADPDSVEYRNIAESFLAGNGFDGTDLRRTVGYPLFIAPISLLPGPTVTAVVVIQHLLGVVLVAAVFLIAERYFGRIPALIAAVVTALSPSMLLIEHHVLPDFLFTVALLAGAVTLIETAAGDRAPQLRGLVIAGLLFGLAASLKPNGQVLIAIVPLVLAVSTRSWRQTLRGSAVVAAAMAVLIVPWVIHNQVVYGHPVFSAQGGQSLWLRVFDQDRLPIPTDSADGVLAKQTYDEYFAEEQPGARTTESYTPVFFAFKERGESTYGASKIQGELALQAIRTYPRAYLEGTVKNIADYADFNHHYTDDEGAVYYGGLDAQTTTAGWSERIYRFAANASKVLGYALWVVSLAGLASLALLFSGSRRQRTAVGVLLATWVVVVVSSSMANHVEARFAAQVAPLQWLLCAAGAFVVLQAVAEFVRRRRGPETASGPGPDPGLSD